MQTSEIIYNCASITTGCNGGIKTGDESCREGHYGPLCSLCRDGK